MVDPSMPGKERTLCGGSPGRERVSDGQVLDEDGACLEGGGRVGP